MTAWLTDNHLLTRLTRSQTFCLPAWLLLSTLLPASPICCYEASYQCQYFYFTFFICAGLYLGLALTAFPYLSPVTSISCLCFSSSAFIDQSFQGNLMHLCRELSCKLRLKPANKETEQDRTAAWRLFFSPKLQIIGAFLSLHLIPVKVSNFSDTV